ncbi:MAG: MBL fold metallo-hydrolase [Solirubrobacteraceae bacterium]
MVNVTFVGGPTALLQYAGMRWLTDPTLSPPGTYDGLSKTSSPALSADEIGDVDVVLLSHDHHSDNLDPEGRRFLPRAKLVLTTVSGAQRLGANSTGLVPWESFDFHGPDGAVTVTALPALHGPAGSEETMGQVVGFLLSGAGLPTVYVSGDNASVEVASEIAARVGQIDLALLFAGAVQLSHRFAGAYLTLSADRAAQVTEILNARAVVPLHFEGWTHFTQGIEQVRSAFAGYGLGDRLVILERGATATF